MTIDAGLATRSANTGSADWQPDAVESSHSSRRAYLETVFETPAIRLMLERTIELLQLRPGQSILEVGCGPGVILPRWAELVGPGGRVVAIDHAESFVADARDRVAGLDLGDIVTVDLGDAYALPYDDQCFDIAHCERVLMHLADPQAALQEMRRVVRPGGRVVAVEPDWQMIPFDHSDPEAMMALYAQHLKHIRQPDMGRTLYRRFGECGLTDRQVVPVVYPITDFSVLRTYGLYPEHHLDAVAANGGISRDRAIAAIDQLETASRDELFFTVAIGFAVAGIVPEA
ncbi:MAG TPA: methyltransferase domain-containing protein [Thermomicrobiales bacterium]|nr:methyltransferase domain-containing protein [Thermomicrobiales bacterium]